MLKIFNEKCFTILTGISYDADHYLVWFPTQKQDENLTYSCVNSAKERAGGSFVLFQNNNPKDEASVKEDGFEIRLTLDSWNKLKEAIENTKDLKLPIG